MAAEVLDDTDLREEARCLWLASLDAGTPVSGADLGRQFGKSDRGGRPLRAAAERIPRDDTATMNPPTAETPTRRPAPRPGHYVDLNDCAQELADHEDPSCLNGSSTTVA